MLATVLLAVALQAVGPGGTVAGRVVRVVAGDTVAAAGAKTLQVRHGLPLRGDSLGQCGFGLVRFQAHER